MEIWHEVPDSGLIGCASNTAVSTSLNRKTFNIKKFRLVETIGFHIKFVSIRVSMQAGEANQDQVVFSVGKVE